MPHNSYPRSAVDRAWLFMGDQWGSGAGGPPLNPNLYYTTPRGTRYQ
jgi:hypothetical protein